MCVVLSAQVTKFQFSEVVGEVSGKALERLVQKIHLVSCTKNTEKNCLFSIQVHRSKYNLFQLLLLNT